MPPSWQLSSRRTENRTFFEMKELCKIDHERERIARLNAECEEMFKELDELTEEMFDDDDAGPSGT